MGNENTMQSEPIQDAPARLATCQLRKMTEATRPTPQVATAPQYRMAHKPRLSHQFTLISIAETPQSSELKTVKSVLCSTPSREMNGPLA